VQRIQKSSQQRAPQQQGQQEIVEMIPLSSKKLFTTQNQQVVIEKDLALKKPETFNDHISCVDKEENGENEMMAHFDGELRVFEGVFGNVVINENGLVLYTDIAGKKYCEEYDRGEIEKVFPMGISYGGLTKNIWFKDIDTRENCYDAMVSLPPPSYKSVMVNPTKFEFMEEEDDSDNMKVFEGINDRNVIVHAGNVVLYTDISGEKHCIHYNKHTISKCFPNGIQDGGLARTIWLKDEMERDLCFMLMRWNMEEEAEKIRDKPRNTEFTGLNGNVVLHSNSQIEFTTLSGDKVKCFYQPSEIQEIFPKGISYGRLPTTIWFRDIHQRDRCIEAMRRML